MQSANHENVIEHHKTRNKLNKQIFFLLWILCLIGSWAGVPYTQSLGILSPSISLKLVVLITAQSLIYYGIISWLSYKILPKTDLEPFAVKNPLKQIIYPGVLSGALISVTIFFIDKILFQSSLLAGKNPPFWTGVLASIYGAINEEVLLRLFLFTLIYFLFKKCVKFTDRNRTYFLWITTIATAIIFGLGHLPVLFKIVTPSAFDIFRVLFLNSVPGLVFGWLYWSRGLWAAMTAHFVADVMLTLFLI